MEEIFEFNIGEMKMKVSIMFKNDIWSSEVLEGDSGMGNASGAWRHIIKIGRRQSNGELILGLYNIINADKDSILRSAIDMWPEAFKNNL